MMIKTIALEGMEFKAPVGYYKKERKDLNTLLIDVSVSYKTKMRPQTDLLKDTFNYENIQSVVKKETALECKLLEDLAQRILSKLQAFEESFIRIKVDVRKKNPPLKGKVKYALVSLEWTPTSN